MESRDAGEHFGLVAITADNAAAVTEHAHDAAVFPVGFLFVIGKLHQPEKIFEAVRRNLVVKIFRVFGALLGFRLDVRDEARPGAFFQLVKFGCLKFCHYHTSNGCSREAARAFPQGNHPPRSAAGPKAPAPGQPDAWRSRKISESGQCGAKPHWFHDTAVRGKCNSWRQSVFTNFFDLPLVI